MTLKLTNIMCSVLFFSFIELSSVERYLLRMSINLYKLDGSKFFIAVLILP